MGGNDIYTVTKATTQIIEAPNGGTDTVNAKISYTLAANIENLKLTAAGIAGTGNNLNNTITDFGTGAGNTMAGGTGNDTYIVNNASDVIIENANEGTADQVNASVSYTLAINVENMKLTAAGITGTGNDSDNIFTDFGGTGAGDTMIGGKGNDTYNVNNANDVIIENAGEGTDQVNASVSYTLGANIENLTLTGSAAINGTGNSAANVITGNGAANTLDGAGGADTLSGGAGADTYIYKTGYGANTIQNQGRAADGDKLTIGNGSGVAITNDDQLWFAHVGNDLQITRIGTTDVVTIQGWYSSASNHVSSIVDSATGHTLTDSSVATLVSAMSAFSPPPIGTTTLDPTRAAAVDPVVLASWH